MFFKQKKSVRSEIISLKGNYHDQKIYQLSENLKQIRKISTVYRKYINNKKNIEVICQKKNNHECEY